MNISKFTVSRLKGPFFMRIQVSHSDVVNYNVVNQSVPINAYLHVELTSWVNCSDIIVIGNVILFKNLKTMKLLQREQVGKILVIKIKYTMLISFFL